MMARRNPSVEDTARFSRKWFLEKLRNFSWVVMVTALIWIYADMEFTDTAMVTATLKLNTGESGQLELLSEKQYALKFDISGSKASLEEFQRELADKGKVLNYDVSQKYPAGEKLISTAELLEAATKLKEKGITIKNVQPPAIAVVLDTMMLISDVPVKLHATGAKYDAPTQKIDIRVPASRWKKIKEKLKGKPEMLSTDPVNLSGRKPGESQKVNAKILGTIEGISVTPVSETVTFDVRIIRTSVTETFLVSVQILTPAAWTEIKDTTWEDYVLVRQDLAGWRLELEVEGSKKDLKPENIIAYIQLTDDDKRQTSWNKREVIVSFPSKMNLKLVSPPQKLEFRLDKRNAISPAQ